MQKNANFESMFTGIIEATGIIDEVFSKGSNKTFWITSSISSELRRDQSLAHNGVCLTIEDIRGDSYQVTAIEETLSKTTLADWKKVDLINLERCMRMNDRLDGHIVQGHVDTTAECIKKTELNGSWNYSFEFPQAFSKFVIEKGSICLNGISLTVFNVTTNTFSVAVIPYTYHHTNMAHIVPGSTVNLEFDVVGKYVNRILQP